MTPTATPLRKKRLWCVSDFAEFLGVSRKQARGILKRFNAEMGGELLMTSGGRKPEYTFFPAKLARVRPEIFERVESLESRVDDLEETVGEVRADQRRIVAQVGANTRSIERLKERRVA